MRCQVLLACLLAGWGEATHVVELHKRDMPSGEQKQLLEFLQLGESSTTVPNALLDSNFFGTIEIGDAHQKFTVVFDTGSSVLWVYSANCEICKEKHVFEPERSHTFHRREIPFNIRYGTGASKGTTGVDNIFLADLEVQSQVFGQCEQPDEVMRGFPFDGIVGLSRSLVTDPNAMPTVINTIKTQQLLSQKDLVNSFSFYIGRGENEPTYLVFGGSHDTMEDKQDGLHWVPTLNKNMYWEVPLDEVYVHRKEARSDPLRAIHLEERPINTAQHDNFARLMADPEAKDESFLELETGEQSLRKRFANGHHQRNHESLRPHSSSGRKQKKTQPHDFESVHLNVRTRTHKRHVPEAVVGAKDRDVGKGELLSEFRGNTGEKMGACKQDAEHMCIVSVDSGHSLMSGPPDMIQKIKKILVPADASKAGSCDPAVMETMPDISFALGGKLFTMTPDDYLIELEGSCVPAFSERQTRNGHDWVLGEHFMRTFYTVFDYDNMRVGMSHISVAKQNLDRILRAGDEQDQ